MAALSCVSLLIASHSFPELLFEKKQAGPPH